MLNKTVTLANGYEIPSIGFGTWQTPDGVTAVAAVKEALSDNIYKKLSFNCYVSSLNNVSINYRLYAKFHIIGSELDNHLELFSFVFH